MNALLLYHDINKETVGKRKYSNIYRNLHSEDLLKIEEAFREIERQYD